MRLKLRAQTGILFTAVLLSACGSVSVASPADEAPEGSPIRKVNVVARTYEFEPEEIQAKKGELVVLTLVSEDVTHGFKMKVQDREEEGIDINVDLAPGQPVEVTFYAREAGVIPFHCSHLCGWGHFFMDGQIVVE
ncbi:MAG: cupredoxin domain-containing protein [Planctomycetota bacterium]|nr:cupredoxin domain-containing protein [Planctomycetota bacterium]